MRRRNARPTTGASAIARARRARIDSTEVGNRPNVANALGFADAAPTKAPNEHDTLRCDVFGCPDCLANQGAA
jgi:hypothetical protein